MTLPHALGPEYAALDAPRPRIMCDFRLLPKEMWSWFPVRKGARCRYLRCPRCNRRLRARTVPDWTDGGMAFYEVPGHRPKGAR